MIVLDRARHDPYAVMATLFACFANHTVKAAIVGGHAVAFHAKPRYTKDLDVFIEPTRENAERALAALTAFGFVAFIGREELIRNKRASGRPQDLADLSWLVAKE